MSKKSIIISSILSLIIVILYIVNEYYGYEYDSATNAYQVYLDGKEIGLIENQDELYSLINYEQHLIKEKYDVDYVYPPNGLDIVPVHTYNNNYIGVNDIYRKIENLDDFTIKGYIITIKSSDKEKKVINVLDKEVFNEAINNFILSFISEEELVKYNNGNRTINEIGKVISNMYFDETITIKEGFISVQDEIFTDAVSLSQYLLFGPDAHMDSYTVQTGDTIASISEDNQINPQEFLIANPSYNNENSLLTVGSNVNVTLINPVITLIYNIYEINENITPFGTETVVDKTKGPDYKEITIPGVNEITLIHDSYEVVNGNASSEVKIISSNVIQEMVKEQVTIGRKPTHGSGHYVNISGDWGLPTNYPYLVTSPYGWRSHKMHLGVDISGTGFRSPIYAVADGTVVEVSYRAMDGNFVIIAHENNIYTQYAHMHKQLVQEGQVVKKGQQIGEMGSTGLAYGVHLHFGVSIGWPYHGSYTFQNPTRYVKLK